MKRRDFIKQSSLLAGASLALPYILPSGRLFAASGSRIANHVVFALFAGGIRNLESVQKKEGNLMRGLLNGNESISPDIASRLSPLPNMSNMMALQNYGTLFKEFRYKNGPNGHYNGHTVALTGQYTDNSLNLRDRPPYPTIFELYRKHYEPEKSAINAWWISHSNNLYPILNYSNFPGYGAQFAANQLSPTQLFSFQSKDEFDQMLNISSDVSEDISKLKNFLNNGFKTGGLNLSSGVANTPEDTIKIQSFITKMYNELNSGLHNDPWGLGNGRMNGDMMNVFYAEKVIQEFKPELTVVNMFGVDVCHTNFTEYCNNLRKIDWAVAHLWNTIQNTPGMANDTILIIAPEIGRNETPNTVLDVNGRGGLDHTNDDEMSRELFCMVVGPPSKVKQGNVVNTLAGESIDIVPTIAHILGFRDNISGFLPGSILNEAFV